MRRESAVLVLTLLGAALRGNPVTAAPLTPQQEVETRLMCYCGCTDLTVRACSCGTAAGIKDDIAARLARGESPDAVVAAYVRERGPQIRSAPTTEGFDLLAWVTPFLALIAGGGFVVHLTRRWRRRAATADAPGGPRSRPVDPRRLSEAESKALERIEREIREEF